MMPDIAGKVVSTLAEPRSFLLFILAIIAVIEYTSYLRTQFQAETMMKILAESAVTLSREQETNRAVFDTLLAIVKEDSASSDANLQAVIQEAQTRREWELQHQSPQQLPQSLPHPR